MHVGQLHSGAVYSGGSCDSLCKLIGAKGKDVLYVGDHIYSDILKTKKIRGWRTFLVVPELMHELYVWKQKNAYFKHLQELDRVMGEAFRFVSFSLLLLSLLPHPKSVPTKTVQRRNRTRKIRTNVANESYCYQHFRPSFTQS